MDFSAFWNNKQNTSTTDKFFVGKGVFVTGDTSIPVNAISMINVFEPPLMSLVMPIVFGALGLLVLFVKGEKAKIIGILLIIVAAGFAAFIYYANNNRTFSLRIQAHSGFMIVFSSKDLEFIKELREKLLEYLNDATQIMYVDASSHTVNKVEHIDMKKIYGDNQEIKGNTIGGNFNASNGHATINSVFADGANQEVHVRQKTVFEGGGLTEQQWNQLAQYFAEQSRTNQKYQEACISLSQYAKKQDEAGFKGFMRKLGSKTMTEIISTATGEILKLFKILLTK